MEALFQKNIIVLLKTRYVFLIPFCSLILWSLYIAVLGTNMTETSLARMQAESPNQGSSSCSWLVHISGDHSWPQEREFRWLDGQQVQYVLHQEEPRELAEQNKISITKRENNAIDVIAEEKTDCFATNIPHMMSIIQKTLFTKANQTLRVVSGTTLLEDVKFKNFEISNVRELVKTSMLAFLPVVVIVLLLIKIGDIIQSEKQKSIHQFLRISGVTIIDSFLSWLIPFMSFLIIYIIILFICMSRTELTFLFQAWYAILLVASLPALFSFTFFCTTLFTSTTVYRLLHSLVTVVVFLLWFQFLTDGKDTIISIISRLSRHKSFFYDSSITWYFIPLLSLIDVVYRLFITECIISPKIYNYGVDYKNLFHSSTARAHILFTLFLFIVQPYIYYQLAKVVLHLDKSQLYCEDEPLLLRHYHSILKLLRSNSNKKPASDKTLPLLDGGNVSDDTPTGEKTLADNEDSGFEDFDFPQDAEYIYEPETPAEKMLYEKKKTIVFNKVNKIYQATPTLKVNAVRNFNLTLYEGEVFVLLGENGAGKTTLLSILMGLVPLTSGEIVIYGEKISQMKRKGCFHLPFVGYCPQMECNWDELTVYEHIKIITAMRVKAARRFLSQKHSTFLNNIKSDAPEQGIGSGDEEEEREEHGDDKDQYSMKSINISVKNLISMIGLKDKSKEKAKYLTCSERKKLSLGMAFAGNPKIVILDEPTTAVDAETRQSIMRIIMRLKRERIIIMTTHFIDEAEFIADRVGIMKQGALFVDARTEFVKKQLSNGYKISITCHPPQEIGKDSVTGECYLLNSDTDSITNEVTEDSLCAIRKEVHMNVINEIKKLVPNMVLNGGGKEGESAEESVGHHNTFSVFIPSDCNSKMMSLLSFLSEKKEDLLIIHYGVSSLTLEDAFYNMFSQKKVQKKCPIDTASPSTSAVVESLEVMQESKPSSSTVEDATEKRIIQYGAHKHYGRRFDLAILNAIKDYPYIIGVYYLIKKRVFSMMESSKRVFYVFVILGIVLFIIPLLFLSLRIQSEFSSKLVLHDTGCIPSTPFPSIPVCLAGYQFETFSSKSQEELVIHDYPGAPHEEPYTSVESEEVPYLQNLNNFSEIRLTNSVYIPRSSNRRNVEEPKVPPRRIHASCAKLSNIIASQGGGINNNIVDFCEKIIGNNSLMQLTFLRSISDNNPSLELSYAGIDNMKKQVRNQSSLGIWVFLDKKIREREKNGASNEIALMKEKSCNKVESDSIKKDTYDSSADNMGESQFPVIEGQSMTFDQSPQSMRETQYRAMHYRETPLNSLRNSVISNGAFNGNYAIANKARACVKGIAELGFQAKENSLKYGMIILEERGISYHQPPACFKSNYPIFMSDNIAYRMLDTEMEMNFKIVPMSSFLVVLRFTKKLFGTIWEVVSHGIRKENAISVSHYASINIFIYMLCLSLLSLSLLTLDIRRERRYGNYQLQLLSGISKLQYWISNYLFDLTIITVTSLALTIWLGAVMRSNISFFSLLFDMILHTFCIVLFYYLESFFSKRGSIVPLGIILLYITAWYHGGTFNTVNQVGSIIIDSKQSCISIDVPPEYDSQSVNDFIERSNTALNFHIFTNTMSLIKIFFPSTLNEIPSNKIRSFILTFALALFIPIVDALLPKLHRIKHHYFDKEVRKNYSDNNLMGDISVKREAIKVKAVATPKIRKNRLSLFFKDVFQVYKRNLWVRRDHDITVALKGLSLAVKKGDVLALSGVSGAGKTSFLNIAASAAQAVHGEVDVNGVPVDNLTSKGRHEIGFAPESIMLNRYLTPYQHLMLFAGIRGVPSTRIYSLVSECLEKFGLTKYADMRIKHLSHGTMKKVSIANSIIGSPLLLILDEPSRGIDPASRKVLWKILNEYAAQKDSYGNNRSIILSTHLMEETEALCNRLCVLANGTLRTISSPSGIREKCHNYYEIAITLNSPSVSEVLALCNVYLRYKVEVKRLVKRYERRNRKKLAIIASDLEDEDAAEEAAPTSLNTPAVDEYMMNLLRSRYSRRSASSKNGYVVDPQEYERQESESAPQSPSFPFLSASPVASFYNLDRVSSTGNVQIHASPKVEDTPSATIDAFSSNNQEARNAVPSSSENAALSSPLAQAATNLSSPLEGTTPASRITVSSPFNATTPASAVYTPMTVTHTPMAVTQSLQIESSGYGEVSHMLSQGVSVGQTFAATDLAKSLSPPHDPRSREVSLYDTVPSDTGRYSTSTTSFDLREYNKYAKIHVEGGELQQIFTLWSSIIDGEMSSQIVAKVRANMLLQNKRMASHYDEFSTIASNPVDEVRRFGYDSSGLIKSLAQHHNANLIDLALWFIRQEVMEQLRLCIICDLQEACLVDVVGNTLLYKIRTTSNDANDTSTMNSRVRAISLADIYERLERVKSKLSHSISTCTVSLPTIEKSFLNVISGDV